MFKSQQKLHYMHVSDLNLCFLIADSDTECFQTDLYTIKSMNAHSVVVDELEQLKIHELRTYV